MNMPVTLPTYFAHRFRNRKFHSQSNTSMRKWNVNYCEHGKMSKHHLLTSVEKAIFKIYCGNLIKREGPFYSKYMYANMNGFNF